MTKQPCVLACCVYLLKPHTRPALVHNCSFCMLTARLLYTCFVCGGLSCSSDCALYLSVCVCVSVCLSASLPARSVFLSLSVSLSALYLSVSLSLDALSRCFVLFRFRHRWYHGDISRSEALQRLASTNPGTFLLRLSSRRKGITLSLWYVEHACVFTRACVRALPPPPSCFFSWFVV